MINLQHIPSNLIIVSCNKELNGMDITTKGFPLFLGL